jgi:sarcosine oxidase subunit delta
LRDNQPGQIVEIWRHAHGCGAWISVTRNTVSHAILGAELLRDRGQDHAG